MRFTSQSLKAMVLIVNHAVASVFPTEAAPALLRGRARHNAGIQPLFTRQSVGGNVWQMLSACDGSASCGRCNGPNEIKDPQDCNKCVPCKSGKKPNPDKTKCLNEDGSASCASCTGKTINDPDNCEKCTQCPPGKEPDKRNRKCVPDKASRDAKEKGYKTHLNKRFSKYKKTAWSKWKKIKNTQYKNMIDRKKNLQVRRMSRCIAVVPYTFALSEMEQHTDLYDENFMDHMNLAEFWPENLKVDDWKSDESDKFMESNDFLDKWAKFGEKLNSRDLDELARSDPYADAKEQAVKDAIIISARRDLILHENQKRFLPLLISIFAAAARTAVQIAVRVAAQVATKAPKIVRGLNKFSRADKMRGARKVADSKHWRRCLEGKGPV